MFFRKIRFLLTAAAVFMLADPIHAAPGAQPDHSAAGQKVSYAISSPTVVAAASEGLRAQGPGGKDNVLIFSAPPRETPEDGAKIYQPVTEYLSGVIGKRIVYVHPNNWLTYQTDMQKGSYDLVFDGPHFNSWRIANIQHNALAKIAEEFVFAVIVRKDDPLTDIKQLAGKKICGMNPPNLGTLAVLGEFDNPSRQPVLIDTVGWARVYGGVVADKRCAAGILPITNLKKYDSGNFSRVIYKTKVLPNQAFSAGPRIPPEEQAKIAAALVSPEASAAVAKLLEAYGNDKGLTRAAKDEYAGVDAYLKDIWGYAR